MRVKKSPVVFLAGLLATAMPSYGSFLFGSGTLQTTVAGVPANSASVNYGSTNSSNNNSIYSLPDTSTASMTVTANSVLLTGVSSIAPNSQGGGTSAGVGSEYFFSVDVLSDFVATADLNSVNPQGVGNDYDYTIIALPSGAPSLQLHGSSNAANYSTDSGGVTGLLYPGVGYQVNVGADMGVTPANANALQSFSASLVVTPVPEPSSCILIIAGGGLFASAHRRCRNRTSGTYSITESPCKL